MADIKKYVELYKTLTKNQTLRPLLNDIVDRNSNSGNGYFVFGPGSYPERSVPSVSSIVLARKSQNLDSLNSGEDYNNYSNEALSSLFDKLQPLNKLVEQNTVILPRSYEEDQTWGKLTEYPDGTLGSPAEDYRLLLDIFKGTTDEPEGPNYRSAAYRRLQDLERQYNKHYWNDPTSEVYKKRKRNEELAKNLFSKMFGSDDDDYNPGNNNNNYIN